MSDQAPRDTDLLAGALGECLSLMARHTWLTRDRPKIDAAYKVLAEYRARLASQPAAPTEGKR